jgi:hypothetical protein
LWLGVCSVVLVLVLRLLGWVVARGVLSLDLC